MSTDQRMDKKVQQFIQVRDIIKGMEDDFKKELAPWKEDLEKLRGEIQTFLDENGLENLATPAGSCYLSERTTASLADPDAFMSYVIQSERYELLERRANATAVKDFVKENKELPPGVNLSTIQTLGVTRSASGGTE